LILREKNLIRDLFLSGHRVPDPKTVPMLEAVPRYIRVENGRPRERKVALR